MQLYIGNKNYSSWSLRAWLLMTQAGIEFVGAAAPPRLEPKARLQIDAARAGADRPCAAAHRRRRLRGLGFARDRRIPRRALPDEAALARATARQRGRARSLCAEMHSGFAALRNRCPMNIEASLPEVGARCKRRVAGRRRRPAPDRRDVVRAARRERRPVSLRRLRHRRRLLRAGVLARQDLRVCRSALPRSRYVDAVCALPAMQAWCAAARAEHDFVTEDEPYRLRPTRLATTNP